MTLQKKRVPWNKGKVGVYSAEALEKMRLKKLGGTLSEEHKAKIRQNANPPRYWLGKRQSLESRARKSISAKKNVKRGPEHHNWKGGITSQRQLEHESMACKLWRSAVFERDDYTCVLCGVRGGKLNADHIKPYSLFPDLRLDLNNGRTLCVPCHLKTDTYGGRVFHLNKQSYA